MKIWHPFYTPWTGGDKKTEGKKSFTFLKCIKKVELKKIGFKYLLFIFGIWLIQQIDHIFRMIFKSSSSKKINERIGLYYTSGRLVFVRFLEEIVGQFEINWPIGSSTQDLYTIILSSSLKPSFPKVQSHYNLVVREKYLPTYLVYCKKKSKPMIPSIWL